MDKGIIDRLIFVKYLLSQAKPHKQKERPLSSFTVLILHDLVEIFLQIALEIHYPDKAKSKDNILLTTANQLNEKLDPTKKISIAYIVHLNNLRNQLKHSSIFIDQQLILELYANTEAFIDDNMKALFGKDLNEISLVSLVKNKGVSKFLVQAEEFALNEDYDNAIISIAKAYGLLQESELVVRDQWGINVMKPERKPEYLSNYKFKYTEKIPSGIQDIIKAVENDFKKINDKIFEIEKTAAYGIDYMTYLKFKTLVPHLHLIEIDKGEYKFQEINLNAYFNKNRRKYDEPTFKFCFDFLLNIMIQMENQ